MHIETTPMFSIPMGQTSVPLDICKKLRKEKDVVRQGEPSPSTDYYVLNKYPEIKQYLTDVFSAWINYLYGKEYTWAITTSWITINKIGAAMSRHRHCNCLYSGILYFDEYNDSHANLRFENPILWQWANDWAIDSNSNNQFFATELSPKLETGSLIFFPSYLYHGHEQYEATTPRKSLAFNFFPTSTIGHGDSTITASQIT